METKEIQSLCTSDTFGKAFGPALLFETSVFLTFNCFEAKFWNTVHECFLNDCKRVCCEWKACMLLMAFSNYECISFLWNRYVITMYVLKLFFFFSKHMMPVVQPSTAQPVVGHWAGCESFGTWLCWKRWQDISWRWILIVPQPSTSNLAVDRRWY